MNAYIYLVILLVSFYVTYKLLINTYRQESESRLNRLNKKGKVINIHPKKALIIQLKNYHHEYIGIVIEYLLELNYNEIYIYETPQNKEWIEFFKSNKYGYPIYTTNSTGVEYDYVFYITLSEMYQTSIISNKKGGIIDGMIDKTKNKLNSEIEIFSLLSNNFGKKIKNYFNFNREILTLNKYRNNFYPEIEYFVINDMDHKEKIHDSISHILNLSLLSSFFANNNKKCLLTSKYKDSSSINYIFNSTTYLYNSNITIHNEIKITDLIKCFLYKKIILIDNDENNNILPSVLYLATSFNTPIYLSQNLYNKFPEYREFNLIPYSSDEHLYDLLKHSPINV